MNFLSFILFYIYFQLQNNIVKIIGQCPALVPQTQQFLVVTCFITGTMCDIPGSNVPSGSKALINCKENYEGNWSNQGLIYTCNPNKEWVGPASINNLWCKAKCGKSGKNPVGNRNNIETKYLKWPWQAAIFLNNSYHCGGSIINPIKDVFLILTTSDCFSLPDGTPIDKHQFVINMGGIIHGNSKYYRIIQNIKDVQIEMNGIAGSLALIQMSKQIHLSDYVQPICLPNKNVFGSGQKVFGEVIGFKSVDKTSVRSNHMIFDMYRSIPLSLMDCEAIQPNLLERTYINSTSTIYCTNITKGQFACNGGGGYSFVTSTRDQTGFTIQGVVGSALTNYTCDDGVIIVEPVFKSIDWINKIASKISFETDDIIEDIGDYDYDILPTQTTESNNENTNTTTSSETTVITYIAGGVIAIGIIALGFSVRAHFRRQRIFTNEEMNAFFKGVKISTDNLNNYESMAYNSAYEIKESQLYLNDSGILGSGTYGIVFKGTYNKIPVAVKTVKALADKPYILALLSELKVMIYLGKHLNIVSLIGAQTKYLQKGVLYIVVELCQTGSLLGYLTKYGNSYGKDICDSAEEISIQRSYENLPILSRHQLLKWALQISVAMEYLENKKVIHADLAARNVLLTENLTVKVSDFGLSRKLYEYTTYVKKHQEPLPWRWMATESLQKMEFSTKSDVWSFGITLWEIFTLGDVPYPGMSYTVDFPMKLTEGLRLYPPPLSPKEIHNLMQSCWEQEPGDRPNFKDIKIQLYDSMGRIFDSSKGEEYTEFE